MNEKYSNILKKMQILLSNTKLARELLIDGTTEIEYAGDSLTVGTEVFVVSGEEMVAAPDGEHTTQSGVKFQTVDGVVTEIEAVEATEPETETVETEEENKDEVNMVDTGEMMERIGNIERELETLKVLIEGLVATNENLVGLSEQFKSKFAKLEKEPKVETKELNNKNTFNKTASRAQMILSSKL